MAKNNKLTKNKKIQPLLSKLFYTYAFIEDV